MRKLLLAFQFLTIVPVKDMGEVSAEDMGRTSALFPLVGLAEGVFLSLSAILLLKVLPVEVTSACLVILLSLVNGGLHLDGLSDTFDAIAVRGDREKKRAVMKEGSTGPVGVASIVLVLLMKYVLLNAVFLYSSYSAYVGAVILMPVLSRWTMVPAAYYGESRRENGLGKLFIDHTRGRELITATVSTAVIVIAVCAPGLQFSTAMFYIMFTMPLLYAFSYGAVWMIHRTVGEMSGDSFGAVNELAVLFLLTMTVMNNAKIG